jgi:hypothetical protein
MAILLDRPSATRHIGPFTWFAADPESCRSFGLIAEAAFVGIGDEVGRENLSSRIAWIRY